MEITVVPRDSPRRRHPARCAGEPRRGCVLHHAVDLDQAGARDDMLVALGLGHRQHGGAAGVGAVEDRRPLLAGAGLELLGEQLAQLILSIRVELLGQTLRIDLEALQELRVELRFDAAHGHVLAVGGLVGVVEGHAGVEQVGAALIGPQAHALHAPDHVRQGQRAVDHGGVDDLSLPRALPFHQRGQHAEHQEHRAAAEVADHIQGRHRPLAPVADRVQHAGQRDVVDIVPGAIGQRAVLAPAGHAPVDEARIAFQRDVRAQAHALGHARTEALEQHVGLLDEPEHPLDIRRVLEVGLDDGAPAPLRALHESGQHAGALHAHDVRAEVGQQQCRVRAGPDPGQFDNPDARERALPGGGCCHAYLGSSFLRTGARRC